MSDPFIAQITMFGGSFAPRSWSLCDGQLVSISQNSALFSLIGTIYGGDGSTIFGLTDLRGRVPMHWGSGNGLTPRHIGQKGGTETVSLTAQNLPAHTHPMHGSSGAGDDPKPLGLYPASSTATGEDLYADSSNGPMGSTAANSTGNTPHANVQPFQCVTFIIAVQGIFPSRS